MKKRRETRMNRVMRDILSSLNSEDVYAFGMFLRHVIASMAKDVTRNNYIRLAEKDNVSEANLQEGIANIESTSVNDCMKVANDVLKNVDVTGYFREVLSIISNNNCNDEFKNEYRKHYIGGYNKFIGVAEKLCTKLARYGLSLLDFQTSYQNLIKENMNTDDINNPYDIQLISENILGEVRKYAKGKHDVKIIKLIDEVMGKNQPYAVMAEGSKRYVQEYPIYYKEKLIRYYLPEELPKELMDVVRKGKLEPMISVSSLEIRRINPKQDDIVSNDESKYERSAAEILANPYTICVVSCKQLLRNGRSLPQVYTTETDKDGHVYLVPCEYPLYTVGYMKNYFCLVNDVPTKQLWKVNIKTLNVASLEPKSDKKNKTKIHKK